MDKATIQAEIHEMWGETAPAPVGDGTTRYKPDNVETWLLNWHVFCQEADRRISWALARADIVQAIGRAPNHLQEFFELYCVIGYEFDEIAEIQGVRLSTAKWEWWKLREIVIGTLGDNRVRYHAVSSRCISQPAGRYFGRDMDEPVGVRQK